MSDRAQMLATIRAVYVARVRGDVEGILSAFAEDVVFRFNAAPLQEATMVHAVDGNELRAVLTRMIGHFELVNFEIIEAVIEGDKAAVRAILTRRSRRSGRCATSEVLDLVQFRDGKICSFTHFFDTAVMQALMPGASGAVEG